MALSPQITPTTDLVLVARFARMMGLSPNEMHGFSTVHRVHAGKSFHYDKTGKWGHAADINLLGAGANTKRERDALLRVMHVARTLGLAVTHAWKGTSGSAAGHQNHLHVDVGTWSNIGQGLIRATKVGYPSREYVQVDTGGARLMIRATPNGKITGALNNKARATVTNFATSNNILWGRIPQGWIGLVHVDGREFVSVNKA